MGKKAARDDFNFDFGDGLNCIPVKWNPEIEEFCVQEFVDKKLVFKKPFQIVDMSGSEEPQD